VSCRLHAAIGGRHRGTEAFDGHLIVVGRKTLLVFYSKAGGIHSGIRHQSHHCRPPGIYGLAHRIHTFALGWVLHRYLYSVDDWMYNPSCGCKEYYKIIQLIIVRVMILNAMNIGAIDLILIGGLFVVFLSPLSMGYFCFGSPNQHPPLLKKTLIGIAGLQFVVLIYFGWLFGTSGRQVNHLKWIAPLILVAVLMWICFGIGFGLAALRYRIKTKS
jgi:hypothetical protein